MAPQVIFYRYNGSPFSNKIDHILLLKNIPHIKVDVPRVLPRPELSDLLGISYRRIPILAIGNNVYCDTSLIASALEAKFPPSQGYGTIFPAVKDGRGAVDSGLQKVYSMFYCDRVLFGITSMLLPWSQVPPEFLEDRSAMRGIKLDPKAITARQPMLRSQLSSHLDFAEAQLSDGREWLFRTETPSLADISLHFLLTWALPFDGVKDALNEVTFPKTSKWLGRLSHLLSQKAKEGSAPSQKISGKKAADIIGSAEHERPSVVGFDNREASRLGLKAETIVQVTPDDYGQSHPTRGKLVGLNREQIVIETQGSTRATVRVHFPRLGYVVTSISAAKL